MNFEERALEQIYFNVETITATHIRLKLHIKQRQIFSYVGDNK